jgi:SAM-dependent methyltransferase
LILDLPAGTGRVAPTLQALGARVVAADISLDMLHQARMRNPTLSQFILCEGENLPLKDGCVDAAVSVRLFQHLPRSAAVRIATELRRVSPRRVYVQVPIEQSWSPIVRALGGLVLRGTLRRRRPSADRAFPTSARLAGALFEEAGLRPLRSMRVSSVVGQLRLFILESECQPPA